MKDFAVSSITYYDLAREKVMNRYPRLISVLAILALICMTGLAIFLISDLVSYASNSDHRGVLVGLDLKGSENGIVTMKDGKEKSGNIGANSSLALENLSRQTKEQNSSNLSQIKSSSSSSPVKRHHSSSSSSSAESAKKSNDKNNLTNQSINNSQGVAKSQIITTAIPASLPSDAIGGITNPVSIIQFKTQAPSGPKSEQGLDSEASSQKSKVTASSRAQKVQEARAKQIANRNQMTENMKKRAAQSRAKAARN